MSQNNNILQVQQRRKNGEIHLNRRRVGENGLICEDNVLGKMFPSDVRC